MTACTGQWEFESPLRIETYGSDYWQTGTLSNVLRDRARALPDEVVYTFLADGDAAERTLTFGELDQQARIISAGLRSIASPGDRAILMFPDGLDCVAGLFGCFYAGVIAVSGVPSSTPKSIDRFVKIARDSRARVVVGTAGLLAEVQRETGEQLDDQELRWIAVDRLHEDTADAWQSPPVHNGSLALLQYTSGSTGDPRGVMLTHRNLLHNLQGQIVAFNYRRGDTGVSWLPFAHDMGLIGAVLMAVYGAGPCVLLSPFHFVQHPVLWLKAISKYRATLSGGPNFAYDLCVNRIPEKEKSHLDLSSWRIAFNGAEFVRSGTLERFAAAFAGCGFRPEAMYPCYGLAEASLFVAGGESSGSPKIIEVSRAELSCSRRAKPAENEEPLRLVGCGSAMPGLDLRIVNPEDGSLCAGGQVGEIWVSGPSVAQGYYNRPEDTAACFTARLTSGEGPYLRTGDLGFLSDDELFIAGRLKDVIIIRGTNYFPNDIEATVESSHAAVRQGTAIAFPTDACGEERLVVVCEVSKSCEPVAEEVIDCIRRAVVAQHELGPYAIVLAPVASAPKTPNGKLQRRLCRDSYEAGTLGMICHRTYSGSLMDPTAAADLRDAVRSWFQEKLRAFDVTTADLPEEIPFAHLDFDSLRIVELRTELENRFGVRVHAADLIRFRSFGDLEDWVVEQVNPGRGVASPGAASALAQVHLSNGVQAKPEDIHRARDGKLRLQRQLALRHDAAAGLPRKTAGTTGNGE